MNARLLSVLLRQSASVFFVFGVMAYVYSCFHKYDWGHPLIKLFCFMTVFFLIVFLRSRADSDQPSPIFVKIEVVVWAIVLALLATVYFNSYGPGLWRPPSIDVGFTTVRATTTFFQGGLNPYSVDNINVRSGLPVEYRGFHYGPIMFIGYFPALFSPAEGYKFATLIYLMLSALLLLLLFQPNNTTRWENWTATALFGLCLFLLPERLWYELFLQGSNDVFPVMFILGSLLALQRQRYFWSGVLLGLSFSAKFSPALFLTIALLRKDLRRSLVNGFLAGLTPLFLFALWDAKGIFNNVFWNRGIALPFDSTSLYSIIPPAWDFLFPLSLLAAVGYSIYRNYAVPIDYENVLVTFTLLLIVAEVTFKQVHGNHLLWFYPLFSLCLAEHRHFLFRWRIKTRDLTLQREAKLAPEG